MTWTNDDLIHWCINKSSILNKVNSSPLDKMAAIFQTISSDAFSWMKFYILIEISLIFVPWGLTDNNQALVKIMAWRRIGDKPLSEPMLTRFTDAYMRHKGEMVNWVGLFPIAACYIIDNLSSKHISGKHEPVTLNFSNTISSAIAVSHHVKQ